jgi:dGTPase
VETQFPGASDRERFQETLRTLIDGLVTGLIEGTIRAAGEAAADCVEAVRAFPSRIARFTPEMRRTSLGIKKFLLENVYASAELEKGRLESTEKLERMFLFLVEHPEKMSWTAEGIPVHRGVCDFIAGMTDRYFLRFYESLNLM